MMVIGQLRFIIVPLLLTILPNLSYARKSEKGSLPFDNCIKELIDASSALSSKNRIRLAVFDFTSTRSTSEAPSSFGSYFAEHLITSLSTNQKFKVFERKRLDAVTKELALNQTGLIDEASAKKIGELAPIDYLLTGTFTKLKNEIEVNGRILDVVTGEITSTFSRKILLTDELSALFPEPVSNEVKKTADNSSSFVNTEEACNGLIEKLKPAYNNNACNDIVNIMTTVPFSSPCSDLHSEAVRYFEKKHFIDKKYRSFFLKEIQSTGDPDKFGSPISAGIYYFGIDGSIDESEWTCIKSMFKHSNRCNSYIRTLLNSKPESAPVTTWYRLIDDYISSPETFCGAPGSSDRASAFLCLLKVMIDDTAHSDLTEYWFKNHAGKLSGEKVNDALKTVSECYHPDFVLRADTLLYKKEMTHIIFFEHHCTPDQNNARTILSFIYKLEDASGVTGYKEWRPFFKQQLAVFGDSCRDIIQKQFEVFPDDGYLEVAFPFCLKHNIYIEGRIPSVQELISQLSDRSSQKQYKAAELLSNCGQGITSFIPQLRKILERDLAADENYRNPQIESFLLTAIVNSGTNDPSTLSFVISILDQEGSTGLPQTTKELIAGMGAKILPQLKKEFLSKRPETRLLMIESIKMMGHQGKEAKEWLKSIRNRNSTSIDEKDAIDDALEAITVQ
jgi:TolB-like protein